VALQNVIQKKQQHLDSTASIFEHKREYAVHYYELWTIKTEEGPTKLTTLS
jgi:hypothetical protein